MKLFQVVLFIYQVFSETIIKYRHSFEESINPELHSFSLQKYKIYRNSQPTISCQSLGRF